VNTNEICKTLELRRGANKGKNNPKGARGKEPPVEMEKRN